MSIALVFMLFVAVVAVFGLFWGYFFNESERDTEEVDTNEYSYVEALVQQYPEIAKHVMQLDSGRLTKADLKIIKELETEVLAERRRQKLQEIAKGTIGVINDDSKS